MIHWVVIPCYNEANRLDRNEIRQLTASGIHVMLVDDGSTDTTSTLIDELKAADREMFQTLKLPANRGKAEAVRLGINRLIEQNAELIGYLDADFSTPAREYIRLAQLLAKSPDHHAVIGSRWLHLGADIQRSKLRHYVSRVYATLASAALRMPVYDTQCGAKVFRSTARLAQACREPFKTRWSFDVELLGRLTDRRLGNDAYPMRVIHEEPLKAWADKGDSKLKLIDFPFTALELLTLYRELRR